MTSPGAPLTPSSSRAPSPLSFAVIEEKVEEEEKAAEETARCPPSPLAPYYTGLTQSDRYAWPSFLGDWAFEDGQPRRVSTGCLGEDENSEVHREVEESYAKDDLAVGRHLMMSQPFLVDVRHVTVRKRNSVCDIEFRFPLLPSPPDGTRHQRPRDLSISPSAACTPSASFLTSQSSIPEWEVVVRRHSCVHVRGNEWVFLICLFVFVCLCFDISVHMFVLILFGLQAMYYLLTSLV
ncbi:uncharacterized protein [Littorina saxatilis]|uniref:Uncharacterized protein n=1 Tax=Littorina saxatilis TaxID=31220 RepID=A0AAN9AQM7_9CAEN